MHWTNIGLILVAIFDIGVAFFVWLRNPKHRINIYFGLNLFGLGLWAFGLAMFREIETVQAVYQWGYFWTGAASISIIPFFLFCFYFPYPIFVFRGVHYFLMLASVFFISLLIFIPNLWHKDIIFYEHRNIFVENRAGHAIFVVIFILYTLASFYILRKKLKTADGYHKFQLKYILITSAIVVFTPLVLGILITFYRGSTDFVWLPPFTILPLNILGLYFIINGSVRIKLR